MDLLAYQKTKCLDFPENYELKLFDIFLKINKNYGATYMSYTFDKSNAVRFSFRSDSNWASVYQNEQIEGKPLIEVCPLDIISRQNKSIFIIWDLYCHESQPKTFREIMGMRSDVGLSHGLTLSTYFGNHHDAIAIATEDKKNDLATRILLIDNGQSLKDSLVECRKELFEVFKKNNSLA